MPEIEISTRRKVGDFVTVKTLRDIAGMGMVARDDLGPPEYCRIDPCDRCRDAKRGLVAEFHFYSGALELRCALCGAVRCEIAVKEE